jgi:hypothetical protein
LALIDSKGETVSIGARFPFPVLTIRICKLLSPASLGGFFEGHPHLYPHAVHCSFIKENCPVVICPFFWFVLNLNSLTPIGGHDRPLFDKLLC